MGYSPTNIASAIRQEHGIDVSDGAVKRILDKPIHRELNYALAHEDIKEDVQKKLDAILDIPKELIATRDEYASLKDTLKSQLDEIGRGDASESKYILTLSTIDRINIVLGHLDRQLEFVAKLSNQLNSGTNIKISNMELSMNIVNVLKQVEMCPSCKSKLNEYLSK